MAWACRNGQRSKSENEQATFDRPAVLLGNISERRDVPSEGRGHLAEIPFDTLGPCRVVDRPLRCCRCGVSTWRKSARTQWLRICTAASSRAAPSMAMSTRRRTSSAAICREAVKRIRWDRRAEDPVDLGVRHAAGGRVRVASLHLLTYAHLVVPVRPCRRSLSLMCLRHFSPKMGYIGNYFLTLPLLTLPWHRRRSFGS